MNIYSIPPLISAIAFLSLGIFVFLNNAISKYNTAFILNCFVTFWWQFCWFVLFNAKDPLYASILVKIGYSGIIFIPITFWHFYVSFLDEKRIFKSVAYSYFVGFLFLIILWGSDLFINNFYQYSWGYYPRANFLHLTFLVFLFYLDIKCFILLITALKKSEFSLKSQHIRYLILSLIFYNLAATDFLVNYGVDLYPFGFIPIMITLGIIAYSITRYRLMDIKVVLEKGLIYSIASIISGILFAVPILLPQYLFNINVFNNLLILTPVVFMVVTLFKPIEELTKKGVIRLFFSQKYKLEQIANKFSDGISRFMKRNEFGEYVTRSATSVFKLNGGASFIYNKNTNQFECADGRGTLKFLKGTIIDNDNPLIKEMMKQNKSILREDFEFAMAQKKDRENTKEIVSAFSNLKSHICIPSISNLEKGHLLGFFLGDEKKSGEPYSQEDIVLLEIFGNQAAASIDNVLLYENQVETLRSSMELEKFASLGETTATVAHEIKNALSYVVTFPQVLEKRKDDKAFLEKAPDTFLHEVERIDLVMQGIVNYAKPSPLKIEKLKLKDLIEETLVLIKSKAKNNRVEVEFICDENLFIEADWNKLKQVFLNLFLNALDAMVLGGYLKIEAAKDNSFVIVKIEDTGVGIPKDKLDTIFEAFYTTKEYGTGLGLAIVKQIIEQNKGIVSVDSEDGKGTIFALKFPVLC